jgi:hypothetical protein
MIIDVSGYSYSGKGAVMDILRDFSGVHVHKKEFEFLLLRAPDGILDLRHALVENVSHIRLDLAIRRFIRLTNVLSSDKTSIRRPLSLINPSGQQYSKFFPGFEELTDNFINSIVASQSNEYWPFPSLYLSSTNSLIYKIKNILFRAGFNNKFNSYLSQQEFDQIASEYVKKVLFSCVPKNNNLVVTSNMLETFNPNIMLKLINPCKLIIVDRDPRGIYLSMPKNKQNNEQDNIESVKEFIIKFKYLRSPQFASNLKNKEILIVKYEEIFSNFDHFLNRLCVFIDKPKPKDFNNFSKIESAKKSHPWRDCKNDFCIQLIEKELAEYCHED